MAEATTPSFDELLQESRRQCGAAAKDLNMMRTEWREAVEALSGVHDRIQEWKDANPDFERTHPELVQLEEERRAASERIRFVNYWIHEARQEWKKAWNAVNRRQPRATFWETLHGGK
ncbi:hypothetical protein AeRB84_001012 [Aphanomyces euteiches]|nr:hypothetical protein AeRB84_001012 [Aphanomyces euteiches]